MLMSQEQIIRLHHYYSYFIIDKEKGFDSSNPLYFYIRTHVPDCLIVIFGPTAVGKSDFAEMLARKIPSEIINADLGQCYTPLSIGTAKPDWRSSDIKQHLFDWVDQPEMISVLQYRERILPFLQKIRQANALPLIVGGSGFYIRSLFFPPQSMPLIQNRTNSETLAKDWNFLHDIDPERASCIHPHDTYRINRAIEIYYSTGKKPSELNPQYQSIGSVCFVYLTRDKQELYQRINLRTLQMLGHGWIDEVRLLKNTPWETFLKKKKLIGYDDILNYLDSDQSEQDKEQLIEIIAQKTRNYAKRQITFGNQLYKELEKIGLDTKNTIMCTQFNLTCGNIELYINQLLETINSMHCFEKKAKDA